MGKIKDTTDPLVSVILDVDTEELRRAFTAVLPHASRIRYDYTLSRLRLRFTTERLIVSATDRGTVGLAYVSLVDHRAGSEQGTIDLTNQNVRDWLAFFKLKPVKERNPGGDTTRIEVDPRHVTFSEVGGIEGAPDGKALVVPRTPIVQMTDLHELMAFGMTRPREATELISLDGGRLARFHKASTAYEHPLAVTPTGSTSALLITCGDLFVGFVLPHDLDVTDVAQVERWRKEWERILPTPDEDLLGLAVDVPMPAKGGRGTVTTDSPESDADTGGAPTG